MMRSILFLIAALALALGPLAGCSSPKAVFYTLNAEAALERTGPLMPVSIVVGPVTVPELVDRPQMVTRVSDNEVKLNEFARWGEPLKSNIPLALAGDLSQLLGTDRVGVFPQNMGASAWQVGVDVLRLDATPGASVTIEALWTVRLPKQTASVKGHTVANEPVTGPGYDAIAAAYSRAFSTVSRDIAVAIRNTPTQ
jgi:uncharacterized lipoprotein YmbA